jgi:hypothetical protein
MSFVGTRAPLVPRALSSPAMRPSVSCSFWRGADVLEEVVFEAGDHGRAHLLAHLRFSLVV